MGEKGLSELYNRDFERRIIGAVLINPDVIDEVIATHLEPYDFYFQDLRAAYTAITRLWQAKESIHVDTIAAEMGDAVENSTDFLIKIYDSFSDLRNSPINAFNILMMIENIGFRFINFTIVIFQ